MACEILEDAMEYIKGYCSKHKKCKDNCRLYNVNTNQCFLYDDAVPCDWIIEREEQWEYT